MRQTQKKILQIFLIVMLVFAGCIRHSDQGLNRKIKRQTANSNITRITPNLMVDDVNKTIDFYKEVIGFDVDVTMPDTGKFNFAILTKGNTEIMIQKRESITEEIAEFDTLKTGGTFTLYIEVNDILMIYNKAIEKAEIVRELHQSRYGTKEFSFKDNNGYILVFSEQLKK